MNAKVLGGGRGGGFRKDGFLSYTFPVSNVDG